MGVTAAALLTVVVLSGWHLRIRRHPSWPVSKDGRFYMFSGYPMVIMAVYWLTDSPTPIGWAWAVGNMWALAAMVSFVYGFNTLDVGTRQRRAAAAAIETLATPTPQARPAEH
jgi:hypothetical protein